MGWHWVFLRLEIPRDFRWDCHWAMHSDYQTAIRLVKHSGLPMGFLPKVIHLDCQKAMPNLPQYRKS